MNEPVSPHPIAPPAVSQMGPVSWPFYGRGLKQVLPMSEADIQLQELRNCRSVDNFFSICNNLAPDLNNDSEFMKQAACIKLDVLNYVGSDLQRNSKFWDSVCSLYSKNIQNALKIRDIQYKLLIGERSNELTVVLSVVSQHGRALQYASEPCQNMLRKEMQRLFLDSSKRYTLG